jgi:hypothetical protein
MRGNLPPAATPAGLRTCIRRHRWPLQALACCAPPPPPPLSLNLTGWVWCGAALAPTQAAKRSEGCQLVGAPVDAAGGPRPGRAAGRAAPALCPRAGGAAALPAGRARPRALPTAGTGRALDRAALAPLGHAGHRGAAVHGPAQAPRHGERARTPPPPTTLRPRLMAAAIFTRRMRRLPAARRAAPRCSPHPASSTVSRTRAGHLSTPCPPPPRPPLARSLATRGRSFCTRIRATSA